MRPPIILMEFDDVLAETRTHRMTALRDALATEDVSFSDEDFVVRCDGISLNAAARAILRVAAPLGVTVDETAIELLAMRAGRAFGEKVARGIPLTPGAAAFVRSVAGTARICIVTRSPRRDVELVLSLAGLEDAFELVVAEEDYAGPEPSSDPLGIGFSRMARNHAVALDDGIALVASLNGVAAARASRIHSIVVGPVSPALAFAGDGYLTTLEGATVCDLVRIASNAGAE